MAIYKNIAAATTHTNLVSKRDIRNYPSGSGGHLNKVTISNYDNTDSCDIKLYLDDETTEHILARAVIPPGATLVLTDNLRFDIVVFSLKIYTSTNADLTVIVT